MSESSTEVRIDGAAATIGSGPPHSSETPAGAIDPRIGSVLKGCYRIERRLGAGGMGAVYLAEHVAIKKKVAVKILEIGMAQRAELKERFLREARAAAAIGHDHVIAIHDFGDTPDGSVFFVMEYLQGVDLAEVIAREAPLPWPRAREIMLQICRGLQAAHDRGIVHRDVKPANVFRLARDDREFVKVLDFGIAKSMNPDENLGGALTRTGMVFGTPEYMSPEQAQGERVDHRVDIYAVGVILFELLTGTLPFAGETFMALLNRHMYDAPPRPSEVAPGAEIPAAAEAVVLKALQKDPALRFGSMNAMVDALLAADAGVAPEVVVEAVRARPSSGVATAFRTRETRPQRRWWPVVAAVLAGAGVAAAIVLATPAGPETPELPPASVPIAAPTPVVDAEPTPPRAADVVPAATPAATKVVVRFDTGTVVADIYDESNDLVGNTADPAGITVQQGEVERRFVLRADGYDEVGVKFTPDRDSSRRVPLTASRTKPVRTGGPKPGARVDPRQPATNTPATQPATKSSGSPDILVPKFKKTG